MPVRSLDEMPDYLSQYIAKESQDIIASPASRALGELEEEAKRQVIQSIQRVASRLRSGRARKVGETGPLQRLKGILEIAQEVTGNGQELLGSAERLRQKSASLDPEQWKAQAADEAIGGLIKEVVRQVLPPSASADSGPQAALETSQVLAPLADAVEAAQKGVELMRQTRLLWNSVADLPSVLDFEVLGDEVIDELEGYLSDLIRQSAGVGADTAEAFLGQRLVPADWIVAIGGPPREFDDV